MGAKTTTSFHSSEDQCAQNSAYGTLVHLFFDLVYSSNFLLLLGHSRRVSTTQFQLAPRQGGHHGRKVLWRKLLTSWDLGSEGKGKSQARRPRGSGIIPNSCSSDPLPPARPILIITHSVMNPSMGLFTNDVGVHNPLISPAMSQSSQVEHQH